MLNYKSLKILFLIVCLLTLTSCSIPKKYDLSHISGFKKSNCVIIKTDGLLLLNINPAQLKIRGGHRNSISEAIINFSFKIEKGTTLKIDQIKTFWDFENGDRLVIYGSTLYDSKETPFIYEDFFTDESSSINFIKNTFESC